MASRVTLGDDERGETTRLARGGGGTPDQWSFGFGASLAYALRFGPALLSSGPWAYMLPVASGGGRVLYAVGFELRLGLDVPVPDESPSRR